ncbi:unnamed protein product [Camellia sinensis]
MVACSKIEVVNVAKKQPLRYQTHRKIRGGFTSSVQMASAITLHGGRLLPNMAMHQISNGGLILFIGRMKMRGGMILTETMNHSVYWFNGVNLFNVKMNVVNLYIWFWNGRMVS